jgi:putative DNA methylase
MQYVDRREQLAAILGKWKYGGKKGICPVPDEALPPIGSLGFRVQRYGMLQWGDLFTARQKVAILRVGELISGSGAYRRPLSLSLGKLADLANDVCPWEPIAECPRNVLSNGRIKPAWDFAEGVVISESSGSFATCAENLVKGIESTRGVSDVAQCQLAAAQASPLPTDSADVWFTDPPYYDAIPYADLSDFFFAWYRRFIPNDILRDPFDSTNLLTLSGRGHR